MARLEHGSKLHGYAVSGGPDETGSVLPAMEGAPLALTPDSWTNGVSGNWTTAADWSTGAAPGASNNATIAAAGTYTVTINSNVAANSLTIDDATAKVQDNAGTLSLATTLAVTAGTFTLSNGGQISGGTISVGNAGVFSAANGTLSGVTYEGALPIGASQSVAVDAGLTLTGASGSGVGSVSLASGAFLYVIDSETLNNATLTFTGAGAFFEVDSSNESSTPTLTLGSAFTIAQATGQNHLTIGYDPEGDSIGNTLINDGTISVTGGTLTAFSPSQYFTGIFTNAGAINVSAGEFQSAGLSLTNTGSFAISGTGKLDITDGSFTQASGGTVITSGGGVLIDDIGGVLLGTINGATTNVQFEDGSLDGVTWVGALSIGPTQTVNVSGGLTLLGGGALSLGTGAEMNLVGGLGGESALTLGNGAVLYVQDNETLNDTTLTFAGTLGKLESGYSGGSAPNTLTLGSSFTIAQTSGQNFLLTDYDYNTDSLGDTIINDGTISVTGGTLISVSASEYWAGTLVNAGAINISGGEFQVAGDGPYQVAGETLTNLGSIAITGTGTMDVTYGSLTLGSGGALTTSGGGVLIDDVNGVLLGTINGATTNVEFESGTLAGVTWDGALSVGSSQTVNVSGGLTLAQGGTLSLGQNSDLYLAGGLGGASAVTVANAVLLDVIDDETLNNTTLNFIGTGATLETGSYAGPTTTTLTLGSGLTIAQATGQNYLTTGYYYDSDTLGDTIVNDGTLSVTGGTLTASSSSGYYTGILTNTGIIHVSNGGTFDMASVSLSNASTGTLTGGTYEADANALLQFSGDAAITTDAATIILSGSGSVFGWLDPSTNDIVTLDQSLASISAAGSLLVLAGRNFTAAGSLADNGLLRLGGGTLTVSSGLSIGSAGTLSGFGTVSGAVSGSGAIQISSGATLDLSGGGSFAGAIDGNGGVLALDGTAPLVLQPGATLGNENIVVDTGATLELAQGGKLDGDIVGAGTLQLDGSTAYTFSSASGFDPEVGILLVDTGASLNANGNIAQNLEVQGNLSVTTGTLSVGGALSGAGAVQVAAGGTLDAAGGGTLTGSLSGAGTLLVDGANPLVLAAGSALGLTHVTVDGGATLDLHASGAVPTTIGGAGTLALGGAFTLGTTLPSVKNLKIDTASSLAGKGTLSAAIIDGGTLTAAGGTLLVTGAISGAGTLSAGSGAVLDLAGGGNFAGAVIGTGTLAIASKALTLSTGATLLAGNVTQTANVILASDAILNGSGRHYTITAGAGQTVAIGSTGTGSAFTNAGTLLANGAGTASISSLFTDVGTASVTSGTLLLANALSGSGTLSAGAGTLLNITGGGSFTGTLTGAGTLALGGRILTLGGAASLSVANVVETASLTLANKAITNGAGDTYSITPAAGVKLLIGYTGGSSSFTNAGTLVANGAGTADIGVAFIDNGTASANSGTLLVAGALSGGGTLSAGASTLVDITGGGSFTGTLTGAGTLAVGTKALTLAAGASLSAATVIETTNLTLASEAITTASGSQYTLTAAAGTTVLGSSGTGSQFTNQGTFAATGAGTDTVNVAFLNSGMVTGSAATLSFLGAVTNNGTIDAMSGLASIKTTVAGTGTLEVGAAGTLSLLLGAGSGQIVDFAATSGVLDLTKPLDFTGTISGFGGSDLIDVLNTAETSYTYVNNVLTLKNGSFTVASLQFTGTSNSFSLASDGHSGTLIKFA